MCSYPLDTKRGLPMETTQEITDKPTKERSLPGGSNAHFHQQEVEGFAPPRLDAGDKTVW